MTTEIKTTPTIFVRHYRIESPDYSGLCNVQFDLLTTDSMCPTSEAIAALKTLLDEPKLTVEATLVSASFRGEDGQLVNHLIR